MSLRKYRKEKFLFLPPVEVTSQEQFVPIFLAFTSPVVYDYRHSYYHPKKDDGIMLSISSPNPALTQTRDAETIKQQLIAQFDHPCPAHYSLPIPYGSIAGGQYHSEQYRLDEFSVDPTFEGLMDGDPGHYFSNYVVHPGILIKLRSTTIPSSGYQGTARKAKLHPFAQNIMPLTLVLVRAKHIPMLRVRIALGLPINLPLQDMKVLRNNNDASAIGGRVVAKFFKAKEPIIEYCTPEVMLPYLFNVEEAERKLELSNEEWIRTAFRFNTSSAERSAIKEIIAYA